MLGLCRTLPVISMCSKRGSHLFCHRTQANRTGGNQSEREFSELEYGIPANPRIHPHPDCLDPTGAQHEKNRMAQQSDHCP